MNVSRGDATRVRFLYATRLHKPSPDDQLDNCSAHIRKKIAPDWDNES